MNEIKPHASAREATSSLSMEEAGKDAGQPAEKKDLQFSEQEMSAVLGFFDGNENKKYSTNKILNGLIAAGIGKGVSLDKKISRILFRLAGDEKIKTETQTQGSRSTVVFWKESGKQQQETKTAAAEAGFSPEERHGILNIFTNRNGTPYSLGELEKLASSKLKMKNARIKLPLILGDLLTKGQINVGKGKQGTMYWVGDRKDKTNRGKNSYDIA